jgi:ABC-type lipoprotein export system ATPase subunit
MVIRAPLLSAHDLSFRYGTDGYILHEWSASFSRGAMTALTGPSGRGKSTLLYLLGLMLSPADGSVRINGTDVSVLPDAARARLRAREFGFVFQDAALDSTRTVIDNVTETCLYRGAPRRSAIPRAHELLQKFGVDVPAQRRPTQVSGGQAQRIALCRALLGESSILLADEPTGNLDPATAELVVRAMREHAHAGATVVVVTHSPEVAAACDEVISLA